MSWYKDAWREIIETVAAEEHRTTQMMEKDTIHSMILLEISKSELPIVFKGGTSLSKAYGLIDRFSEDNIPEMLKEIISSRFYEPDYNSITQKLLYEDVSYDEAVERGIAIVADSDIFLYRECGQQ